MNGLIGIIGAALFIAFFMLAGPWCFIWAINTLISAAMMGAPAGAFVPQIAFGFWTWLAAVIFGGIAIIPAARRHK